MAFFSCHLTRISQSGGNPEPRQNHCLKQHPYPDEKQKDYDFVHKMLRLYTDYRRVCLPIFQVGANAADREATVLG
jgi:hypothetical protein